MTKHEIIEQKWQSISMDSGLPIKIIDFARRYQLLPEAYLFGFQFVLKNSAYRYAYLNGEYSITGWWYFFPYACLVKTPLPLLGIFLIVFLLSLKKIRKLPSESIVEKLYPYAPLIALISVYGIFAVTSNINIGNRHVLLFFPAAYILVGAGGAILKKNSRYLRIAI